MESLKIIVDAIYIPVAIATVVYLLFRIEDHLEKIAGRLDFDITVHKLIVKEESNDEQEQSG